MAGWVEMKWCLKPLLTQTILRILSLYDLLRARNEEKKDYVRLKLEFYLSIDFLSPRTSAPKDNK